MIYSYFTSIMKQYYMINSNILPEQCRAARAILNWSQPELAKRCGITVNPILSFEKESGSQPAARTMRRIVQAFELAGIAFTATGGVERQNNLITIIEGEDANLKIHDDIYHTLKERGGEVLCSGITELDESAGEKFELLKLHIDRIKEAGITERILLKEGDTNIVAPREWYRWLPAECFGQTPFQIYGSKIALKDFDKNQILLIEHQLFAESQKAMFNALWNMAKPVDTGVIGHG